jgi:hypothetical protein
MASQNPPRSSDDMILFALEQALREVWAVLKAHDPHGYLDKDDGLQKAIADKLMALADSGVTDPQELRRRTLENFAARGSMRGRRTIGDRCLQSPTLSAAEVPRALMSATHADGSAAPKLVTLSSGARLRRRESRSVGFKVFTDQWL